MHNGLLRETPGVELQMQQRDLFPLPRDLEYVFDEEELRAISRPTQSSVVDNYSAVRMLGMAFGRGPNFNLATCQINRRMAPRFSNKTGTQSLRRIWGK
jgi:hypothetical protein